MYLFYTPTIAPVIELPETEAQHCIRVLRMKTGDTIRLTDGAGHCYSAVLSSVSSKSCIAEIRDTQQCPPHWPNFLEIAVAPTKNMERMEWFVEKATEIGINKISFIRCRFSERKELKLSRLEKVAIAAMKQSLKATLPELQALTDFNDCIRSPFRGQQFISHCRPDERQPLCAIYHPGDNCRILIGPEGDFCEEEISDAKRCGFIPVTLGESRLRTETAALCACQTIHTVNQLHPQ
ncbi:MAG: 16S rRNA (uracil(1498)-N(3))-methyltransferase [Dysgonamonadaceae bacterium]|jgi:16S rRNA (uracil1498-N3)-methyltransferase|nr:16S rRNA (uracil(1498)-N(3))-methyltransferase [Dysgonamonadaceae bacterium]